MKSKIKQGDIYIVNFDPQIGSEIKKTRPALVVDSDIFSNMKIRMLVPITSYQKKFDTYPWMYKIENTPKNGLTKLSIVNTQQTKYASTDRFINKIGAIEKDELEEIHKLIVMLLEPTYEIS